MLKSITVISYFASVPTATTPQRQTVHTWVPVLKSITILQRPIFMSARWRLWRCSTTQDVTGAKYGVFENIHFTQWAPHIIFGWEVFLAQAMNKMVMFVISETVFSFYEPFAISLECLLRATVTNKKVNIRLFCAPHSEGTSGESNIWPIFLQFI